MQLAQLNIASARFEKADPRMAGFTNRIEQVYALAENSDGFIWRLVDDEDADGIVTLRLKNESDYTLINMSVWRDIESLHKFIYKTAHAKIMAGKDQWFTPMAHAHMVMWWIADDHKPDLEEGFHKLVHLRQYGCRPDAFDFRDCFDRDGRNADMNFSNRLEGILADGY